MNDSAKQKVKELPLSPGVYLMKDKQGTIIYVGKAKKLKERVGSYFVQNKQHSKKTIRMIHQLDDFDVIVVSSELDALLLECQLIQTYRPLYNRQMNSFERYRYIELVTNDKQIQLHICSVPTGKNCFGPYPIRNKLAELKRILEETYGLNSANFWQQQFSIQQLQPLDHKLIKKELLDAFNNRSNQVQTRIEAKMNDAAANQSFEQAIKLRDDWQFITHFFNQNKRIVLATQPIWQLLWFPNDTKINYYLVFQGLIVGQRVLTKRTFQKYSLNELAMKIAPKKEPKKILSFSKNQIDFVNILYSYINRNSHCQLVELRWPFISEKNTSF